MNHLLCLENWIPHVSCYEFPFGKAPFWIQIHNLSLENLNVSSAFRLMSKDGEVMEVDNRIVGDKILPSFVRGRVRSEDQGIWSCWVYISMNELKRTKDVVLAINQGKWREQKKETHKESYVVDFPNDEEVEEIDSKAHLNDNEECSLPLGMVSGMSFKKRRYMEEISSCDKGNS